MPTVRKLTPEEVQEIENKGKGQRKLVEEQYDALLGEYGIGDYGEALLEDSENRLTVRNRLKAAARRRGVELNFRRTKEDLLRFQMIEPQAEPVAPKRGTGKKPGRKKRAS